jgi:hypothetical protein
MVNVNAIMGSCMVGAGGESADGCFCFTLEQRACLTGAIGAIDATHPFVCAMPCWWPVQVSFMLTKRAFQAGVLIASAGIRRLFEK